MSRMQEKLNDVAALTKRLQQKYPTETNAFLGFLNRAEAGPALSLREKELINVGLAVAAQCEWCIAFHVQQAVAAGASRDEIAEAGFMAVIMHGGPAYMYMTPLFEALDEFLPESD
ncbi:MAG TPA: carboxymuconolactone decarboxylase family protein [Sedimenticola thiotaurini]|uniref:Carboxymuconolactone decarboxylase family protein n=1 Tax=Sedimenticola thiotaurini TaxID=1543721 RepID=A0A831RMD9_9GAMM|nr:carboxymuconolactone decarboxylase family protein [Sedimenticola thiotaurini]